MANNGRKTPAGKIIIRVIKQIRQNADYRVYRINITGLADCLGIYRSYLSEVLNYDKDMHVQEDISLNLAMRIIVVLRMERSTALEFVEACGYIIDNNVRKFDPLYIEIVDNASTASLEELNTLLGQLPNRHTGDCMVYGFLENCLR